MALLVGLDLLLLLLVVGVTVAQPTTAVEEREEGEEVGPARENPGRLGVAVAFLVGEEANSRHFCFVDFKQK
jgi:hypothetical protein